MLRRTKRCSQLMYAPTPVLFPHVLSHTRNWSCRYVVDNFLDEMERLAEDGTHEEINSYFFMEAIIFDVIIEIVIRDGLLAIFSLVFVFIWLRINTGSWFLSAVGIFVSHDYLCRSDSSFTAFVLASSYTMYSNETGNLHIYSSCLVFLLSCLSNQIFLLPQCSYNLHCGSNRS